MKKKLLCVLLTMALAASMIGCGKTEVSPAQPEQETHKEEPKEEISEEVTEPEQEEPAVDDTPYFAAYADAVEQIIEKQLLPDGDELEYYPSDEYDVIAGNEFAVADVDEDGIKELIIYWMDASMAGMGEYVYQYNPEKNSYTMEICGFPGMEYYEGGYNVDYWSHNQGMGEMWPYTVSKYNSDTDTYDTYAMVDSWSKEYFETSYDGEPFPDDVDTDGAGVLYAISDGEGFSYPLPYTYTQSAYDKWYEDTLGNRKRIEFRTHKMTVYYTQKLREGKLDPVIEGTLVSPKNTKIQGETVPDGVYAMELSPYSMIEEEGKIMIFADLYEKELFDTVQIKNLAVGDGIDVDGEITRVEDIKEDNGEILINGGLDEGGINLIPTQADDGYVFHGWNDYATFTSQGTFDLYLSADCLIVDSSDWESEAKTIAPSEFMDYAPEMQVSMNKFNTSISVKNGEVVDISIVFTP